ncbi:MAG: DNA translocase FtsK 4TM domain-containing protein [Bacteroidaceae bacterium]|nr:DNA translocase FtsK 4TM domain-containing protein [Bacteroidaceae bacterium]
MAQNKNTKKKNKGNAPKGKPLAQRLESITRFMKNEILHFIIGFTLSLFGIFLLIALTSFIFTGTSDQSIVDGVSGELTKIETEIENWGGANGAIIANFLINQWMGFGAFVLALWVIITGMHLMRVVEGGYWKSTVMCFIGTLLISLFFGFLYQLTQQVSFISWGGNHGKVITDYLFHYIGSWGTGLIIVILLVVFLIMVSRSTIYFIRDLFKSNPFRNPFARREKSPVVEEDNNEEEDDVDEDSDNDKESGDDDSFIFITENEPNEDNDEIATEIPDFIEPDVEDKEPVVIDEEPIVINEEPIVLSNNDEPTFTVSTGAKEELFDEVLKDYDPTLDLPRYKKPTLDLLAELPETSGSVDRNELESNKKRITDTLMTYGIEISSIQATVGPTVTLYEIVPAPGVRIARIKNLENDIALSLAALGIRIIAPIPGKGTIGIEVPNNEPQVVSMRSIIASRKFQESKYELPIALGKTITNEVYIADLTKMPHVLVAGATGQGKSVGLNAIISSLLYKKHPAELKFVLVDPKKVEFSIYSAIERHFLAKLPDTEEPIITDTNKVVQTLQSVTREMDMRYDLLKAAKVRTIKEYNTKFKSRHLLPSKGHRFLPYIVVIIDEFSDLIMTAGKEVESPIIRIAQLARAVGIHMIIATQRPSTNVITGIIKANFPARIAFRVQSMIDSRTILDCPGANQLIGRGDMLISQGGEMVRVQCAFIDTPEVEDLCHYISEQQSYPDAFLLPEYVPEESEDGGSASFDAKDRDPLFEEAARIIVSSQQASTSSLQRRYSIGYNRAGRLMDQLEAAGIVGPAMGGKPREVLVIDMMQLENKLELMK